MRHHDHHVYDHVNHDDGPGDDNHSGRDHHHSGRDDDHSRGDDHHGLRDHDDGSLIVLVYVDGAGNVQHRVIHDGTGSDHDGPRRDDHD